MDLHLYELCGRDPDLRFSPWAWRTRMALAHKGLSYTPVPWRFTEKDAIAITGQGKIPVLKHGDNWVYDSWDIALYLEDTFPDRPSLFGGPVGLAAAQLIRGWADRLVPTIAPLAVLSVWELLDEKDQAYFRETREARFGKPLEEVCGDVQARIDAVTTTLAPLRDMLAHQPFIGGNAPLYTDHMFFGGLQWLNSVSNVKVLQAEDPTNDWFERMLDAYDGMARKAKICAEAA